jgi:hypothetical protein
MLGEGGEGGLFIYPAKRREGPELLFGCGMKLRWDYCATAERYFLQ